MFSTVVPSAISYSIPSRSLDQRCSRAYRRWHNCVAGSGVDRQGQLLPFRRNRVENTPLLSQEEDVVARELKSISQRRSCAVAKDAVEVTQNAVIEQVLITSMGFGWPAIVSREEHHPRPMRVDDFVVAKLRKCGARKSRQFLYAMISLTHDLRDVVIRIITDRSQRRGVLISQILCISLRSLRCRTRRGEFQLEVHSSSESLSTNPWLGPSSESEVHFARPHGERQTASCSPRR